MIMVSPRQFVKAMNVDFVEGLNINIFIGMNEKNDFTFWILLKALTVVFCSVSSVSWDEPIVWWDSGNAVLFSLKDRSHITR